ncbi:MAG: hypothetical protein LBT53_00370 [Puniceicoccales bacterium]|nr:hypothetical protein [Puniceicoccales bacterium]
MRKRARGKITVDVWALSQHSAGLVVRFKTNATPIRARHKASRLRRGRHPPRRPSARSSTRSDAGAQLQFSG